MSVQESCQEIISQILESYQSLLKCTNKKNRISTKLQVHAQIQEKDIIKDNLIFSIWEEQPCCVQRNWNDC